MEASNMSKELPTLITKDETEELLKQFNPNSITGLRNKTLVSLLAVTGLQLKELINLKWKQLDLKEKLIKLEDRSLSIDDNTTSLLKSWRKRQKNKMGKTEYVFTTISKSHKTGQKGLKGKTRPGKPLQDRYIRRMIRKYAKKAGLSKEINPQVFRRTFGYKVYKNTYNLKKVQNKLGLNNIDNAKYYKSIYKKYRDDIKKTVLIEKLFVKLLQQDFSSCLFVFLLFDLLP